jgi:hypothetical protein
VGKIQRAGKRVKEEYGKNLSLSLPFSLDLLAAVRGKEIFESRARFF